MSGAARLDLTRAQILAFRRRAGALDARLPVGAASLRRAAWAGLADSMPRAALLSIHARVEGTGPDVLDDPVLEQVWGLRFSVYVAAAEDRALFTISRMPEGGRRRNVARELAARLADLLGDEGMTYSDAGRALGEPPNRLRYALTGTIVLHWDGARRPTIWSRPAPDVEPADARRELARRYLAMLGPSTAESFAGWAGINQAPAVATFGELEPELTPVRTPIGDAWILASDEAGVRAQPGPDAPARLLPSGDLYYLLWGSDRELLVPDAEHRAELWTSRVWPGAVLVGGEIAGTWRRTKGRLTVTPWRRLPAAARAAVEAEAVALPLPGIEGEIEVRWEGRGGSPVSCGTTTERE